MANKLKARPCQDIFARCWLGVVGLALVLVIFVTAVIQVHNASPPFERMLDSAVKIEADGATCSGVVVLSDGLILTNAHCMEVGTPAVLVTLRDGRAFKGLVLMRDGPRDVAVVSINLRAAGYRPGPLAHTPLDCAARLAAGDDVYAVGHPGGHLVWTLTRGIVSALGREGQWTQVDALLWYGNSGGPLFDAAGRLVGLNNALLLSGGQVTGHGFALNLKTICEALKAGGVDLT